MKIGFKFLTVLSLLLLSLGVTANTDSMLSAASNIAVKMPLVPLPTAKTKSTKVFMDIVNNGERAQMIVAAFSPIADSVALHNSLTKNGKTTDVTVREIVLNGEGDQQLRPNGFHLMLQGLKKSLIAGQNIPITLVFGDGSYLETHAQVEASSQISAFFNLFNSNTSGKQALSKNNIRPSITLTSKQLAKTVKLKKAQQLAMANKHAHADKHHHAGDAHGHAKDHADGHHDDGHHHAVDDHGHAKKHHDDGHGHAH